MAKIKIYSKDPCPYCLRAFRLLENKGLKFEVVDLTDKPNEIDRIKMETGWRTVPIIFINDGLIGGYEDLKSLDDSGELDQLLK